MESYYAMINLTDVQASIAALWQAERPLSQQVLNVLIDRYEQVETDLPAYFTTSLNQWDEVDLDLAFSPLFTPSLTDKIHVFSVLQSHTLAASDITVLIQQLDEATINLVTPAGYRCQMKVPEINRSRFVSLLGLDRPLASSVYEAIVTMVPLADQPTANVLARDVVWKSEARQAWLIAFMTVMSAKPETIAGQLHALTDFIRTYRPQDLQDMERQLESYIRSCETDFSRSGELHFHDERLKEKYLINEEGHHSEAVETEAKHVYVEMMATGRQLRDLCEQAAKRFPDLAAVAV
jgi:hypothetical protein